MDTQVIEPGCTDRPSGGERLRALLSYLLPAWVRPWVARRTRPFEARHAAQATGLDALLDCIVLWALLSVAFFSWAMVSDRRIYENWHESNDWVLLGLFALLLGLVLAGCALAATGSRKGLPIVASLGERAWIRRMVMALSLSTYLFFGAMTLIATHSTRMARGLDGRPARVYLLYDSMGFVPRWVLTLGAYRMCRAADDRWGRGSCVVAEISAQALTEALREGSLVYIATHGAGGDIHWVDTRFNAVDLREIAPPGPNLDFVYVTACDGGANGAGAVWRKAFAPATVTTFDRLSANIEHTWWLWAKSPSVIASLKPPSR